MTVQEMHIGIDLLLQKVNSNIISNVKSEEKDVLLNNEVLRYINQRINPKNPESKGIKFQGTSKRYEDLKALIEPYSSSTYVRDNKSVFIYLPSNCLHIINDRSITKNLCGLAYAPTTTTEVIYYTTLKLPLISAVNNYLGFTIIVDGITIFDITNYPQFASITSDKQRFQLIDFILEALKDKGYEAKYENYLDMFSLESIIIKSNILSNLVITYITNPGAIVNEYLNVNFNSKNITKITTLGTDEHTNILTETEDIYKLLDSSFGSTEYNAPLSTFEKGKLNIYHKQKFIISSVNIDFIRKPRKISLPLNQSCDLDPSTHTEIVENLATRLAGITTAQNYQLLLNENLKKE